jgi:cobalamin biosynthesis protein CbiG
MNTGNKVTVLFVTDEGRRLAERLRGLYDEAKIVRFAETVVENAWAHDDTLIFVMAAGIVVRTISGLVRDKRSDPAVIVLDERGNNVISLLSGHLGGE